jgi:hypothetical protein
MDEKRSFGYVCPKCGKAVIGTRTRFALMAAAVNIECECTGSTMQVETDGERFRFWVPCGFCGEKHQAECRVDAVLEGKGIGLSCPKTHQLCAYAGEEGQVTHAVRELEQVVEKEKAQGDDPAAFADNTIMYEVLSELRDIAGRDGISCTCGSHAYAMQVRHDAVDLTCKSCGGKLRLGAATDEDLDRLCCQYKLQIKGK